MAKRQAEEIRSEKQHLDDIAEVNIWPAIGPLMDADDTLR